MFLPSLNEYPWIHKNILKYKSILLCNFTLKGNFFLRSMPIITYGVMVILHYRKCLWRALSQCRTAKCQMLHKGLAASLIGREAPGDAGEKKPGLHSALEPGLLGTFPQCFGCYNPHSSEVFPRSKYFPVFLLTLSCFRWRPGRGSNGSCIESSMLQFPECQLG